MKTFVVAEMSGNHGGKLENAIKTVHAVKETGADAIKLQTYTADTITLNCDADDFVVNGTTRDCIIYIVKLTRLGSGIRQYMTKLRR